ncbi:MAG: phosphoribosylamine--glycine ligase [Candidatus Obscuribacterales bacterium]|nr:phosphoribosylamine--glycine ligase [Candidatus Obscuribacterales bacterium]
MNTNSPNNKLSSLPESAHLLVVGGGGREHALCWKLAQSPNVSKIYCAPGNGGTGSESKTENLNIPVNDFAALREFAEKNNIDLTVIGPDNPLAEGIVDYFNEKSLPVFGPTKLAAKLEWSKAFAKEFMSATNIPTPKFVVCSNFEEGMKAVKSHQWARVVKADGLALGKGVFVCNTEDQCKHALEQIFTDKIFGAAGEVALIEEKIRGEELSLLLFCDGESVMAMPASQDHKRRFDNDQGPNTGGMGVYSPVPLFEKFKEAIDEQVIKPLQKAIAEKKIDFQGILYAGLMIGTTESEDETTDDNSKARILVLEFNARFGDPETQALMPLLDADLYQILDACQKRQLKNISISWKKSASCCVIAAASSYPESSSKNEIIVIKNLPSDVFVFHAGTKLVDGKLLTNGGRVLAVTAVAQTMEQARAKAYAALEQISFKDISFRSDIGRRAAEQCLST